MKHSVGLGLSLILAVAAVAMIHAAGEGPWPGALSPLVEEASLNSGGVPWPGAGVTTSLSADYTLPSERAHFTLAPDFVLAPGGKKAVIWASETETSPKGIFLAQAGQHGGWSTQVLFQDAQQEAWLPSVAYSGTQLLAAWVQGTYSPVPLGDVVQYDVSPTQAQVVMTQAYGYVAPRLVVGANGVHMVYAARRPEERTGIWTGDLYYVHRALTQSTWSTPTIVVSHTGVMTQAIGGGIRHPRVALSEDGTRLHMVWQQEIISGTESLQCVWYISGTPALQGVQWGQPMRVSSPTLQMDAVQPDVAVDDRGGVHIAFTTSMYTGTQTYQHIMYSALVSETWSTPLTLTAQAIQVTKNSPTWAASAVDALEDLVCVVWHGYYGGAGTSREEVFLRCSQDRGATWQVTVNVPESPDTLSIFPCARLDEWAQVHVVWGELMTLSGSNFYEVFYRTGSNEMHVSFFPVILRGF